MRQYDSSAPNWAGVLQKGERIIWQGRPSGAIHLGAADYPVALFALFFIGFSLFWIQGAMAAGGHFWMFGLIHLTVGIAVFLLPFLWAPLVRRRSYYTLTNRRALISRDLPFLGRKLETFPLSLMSELSLNPGNPGSILFADRYSFTSFTRRRKIGFEYIPDAETVFGLMTRRQEVET